MKKERHLILNNKHIFIQNPHNDSGYISEKNL